MEAKNNYTEAANNTPEQIVSNLFHVNCFLT